MTKYAKLINQTLEFYVKPSNYGQISDADLKLLAEAEGFKKVNYDEIPLFTEFYTVTKRETTKNIYVEYAELPLEDCKLIVKTKFDNIKDANLNNVKVTYNNHDYKIDQRAETNILASLIMGVKETPWITANDEAVVLTANDLQQIAGLAKEYTEQVYTDKMIVFAQIDASATLEQLIELYNQ